MRVAIFTDTFKPQVNGVCRYLEEMQKYMDENQIAYRLFVPGGQSEAEMKNVTVFHGRPFILYPELSISLPDYSIVDRELNTFKPDIIYLATEVSMGLVGLKYARRHNVPVVAAYHTDFPHYLRCYRLNFFVSPVWKYLAWFHSFSEMNVCSSMETFDQLLEHRIGALNMIGHGIDCEKFSPAMRSDSMRKYYAPNVETLLLYVGRLAQEKNLDVLLNACSEIQESRNDLKLLIVGDGPAKSWLEKQNIPNVILLGYKSGEELSTIYASADIFVFPSASETFENVILEAMSSGLPVVAVNAGGVKDSLQHMHNGLAFRPGDHIDMAECIQKLMDDPHLTIELALKARSYALCHSWENTFNSLFTSMKFVVNYARRQRMMSDFKFKPLEAEGKLFKFRKNHPSA
jgi:glycosyltransferase involved in cell wall biosynthesis